MNTVALESYIKGCESYFIHFCEINSFPKYQIVSKELTLDKALKQGFDSVAAAFYDVTTGTHRLEIWSQLYLPQMNAKYLVFHEFTHILDAEIYSQKDKLKNVSNKGYTEYHAAQNDLMQLLGEKSVSEQFSFNMNQHFETFSGKKSALEFLMMPHKHAVEMINRKDFPANIEALAVTLSLIFNYYGRRSICKMYANNFEDTADNTIIARLIHEDTVKALDVFMVGRLDKGKVAMIDTLYQRMAISLAQQFKLA